MWHKSREFSNYSSAVAATPPYETPLRSNEGQLKNPRKSDPGSKTSTQAHIQWKRQEQGT